MKLRGEVSIITGAGSGIGCAIAVRFAQEGSQVAVIDKNQQVARKVANEIKNKGFQAIAVRADVGNYAAVQRMVKITLDSFGKIDVLVNNAGINIFESAERFSLEQWRDVNRVNYDGVFFCSQLVGKEMIKRKRGKIINISSMAGLAAIPDAVAYVASKHGVIGITKALAVEWARYDIRVNCVCPGRTNTPLVQREAREMPKRSEERKRRIPLGRLATPEDQAAAALFLASSDSDYITGLIMYVDGGNYALFSGYSPPGNEK